MVYYQDFKAITGNRITIMMNNNWEFYLLFNSSLGYKKVNYIDTDLVLDVIDMSTDEKICFVSINEALSSIREGDLIDELKRRFK